MAQQTVEDWVQHLSDENMPVFSSTVAEVTAVVNNERSSAADVAQSILRDASLTSRLLKMANNFFYNPSGQEINTISRAVMIMGFDQIRALALSLVLVDSLGDGTQRERLTEEMSQSFHAAIQAQEIAKKTGVKSPENVFIATLLSRVGNMAFWAFADDKAPELDDLLSRGELSEEEAERKVLGFPLKEISKGLGESWSLGELLGDVLADAGATNNPDIIASKLGQQLAEAAKDGWNTEQAEQAIETVAVRLDMPILEIEELVYDNAKQAKSVSRMYGIQEASKKIPIYRPPLLDTADDTTSQVSETNVSMEMDDLPEELDDVLGDEQEEITPQYPEPDPSVQLTVMEDITQAVEEKANLNIILEMVLEGIYRGVGTDRTFFAVLTPDRKKLVCKYALGEDSDKLANKLVIDVSSEKNIFHQMIERKKAMKVPADPKQLTGTLSRETLTKLGTPPYIVMPCIVRDKVIGVFFADRNASKRKINEQDFIAFQQFCQQANMGITFLSMKG
jgi:HD-like signal output (HDOD) protein